MAMKYLILSTCVFLFSAVAVAADSVAPVKINEDVEFIPKDAYPLLDMTKSKDFVGILVRQKESSEDLRKVDLYAFKNVQAMKMDRALCAKLVARMFGDVKDNPYKFSELVIFKAHTGNACEAVVIDPDKGTQIPERRVILGFINLKPLALVFRFSKKTNPSLQQAPRDFWATLR